MNNVSAEVVCSPTDSRTVEVTTEVSVVTFQEVRVLNQCTQTPRCILLRRLMESFKEIVLISTNN